jgi:hypothetical protein
MFVSVVLYVCELGLDVISEQVGEDNIQTY